MMKCRNIVSLFFGSVLLRLELHSCAVWLKL